jgi:beta-glucosidase
MKGTEEIWELIGNMTLKEKASLCSGKNFWTTKGIERLSIPSIMMTDGPHGLRKQETSPDHLGISNSVPSTCFPSGASLGASWDRNLIAEIAEAIGIEAKAEQIGIVLGPGVNIKRSPLCGRNFEYLSEDPYLSGKLAKSYIKAIQAKGIGASLKHFTVNNQETRRMTINTEVDERTLREIYLPGFEIPVKESQPWTVMCAYNMLNGTYCSEHPELLTKLLKEEWGHKGLVLTDWGACNDRVEGLKAGMELEMPGSYGMNDEKIEEAVSHGELPESILDNAVARILSVIFKVHDGLVPGATYNMHKHHTLARRAASECAVLLKNENRILPLSPAGTIAIIGTFAKQPRYQGGGSSHINPNILDTAYNEIEKLLNEAPDTKLLYADGFNSDTEIVDEALFNSAVETAAQADTVLFFAGLPDYYESESFDRTHLKLPLNQTTLIEHIAERKSRVIVLLSNGAPIEMPWLHRVPVVLEGYLGGQAGGGAIADIIFGRANPSGKLAETFPVRLEDTPAFLNFPGETEKVEYREGLFVGYRYYEAKKIKPLFPFGFGLSYTDFYYSNLTLSSETISDKEILTVYLNVKNTGNLAGKEIVQLYVSDDVCSVIRPEKELKGFEKVTLEPGEEIKVEFNLDFRSFAFWSTECSKWIVEPGSFSILVGSSSASIFLKDICRVEPTIFVPKRYTINSRMEEIFADPVGERVLGELMKSITGILSAGAAEGNKNPMALMMQKILEEAPLRAMIMLSGGKLTFRTAEIFLSLLNGEISEKEFDKLTGHN